MRFYYCNCVGDTGYFTEKNLIKAIYAAWNIDADLYLLNEGERKLDRSRSLISQSKIVFAPFEGNEFNSDVLNDFGYYMTDGDEYREIRRLDNNKEGKYNWSDVKNLI